VALLDLRGGPPRVPGAAVAAGPEVAVGVTDPQQPQDGRAWRLAPGTLRLVNPNTGTLPLFGSGDDARITTDAYRRWPVLLRRDADGAVLDDPWGLRLVTPLHMTRDAKHFRTAPGPGLLPLWEAKHAGLLDHLGGIRSGNGPRYWVPAEVVTARYGDLCARGWLAGYRNVTTVTSPRTLLPCALPVLGVGNSLPLLTAERLPLLLAALASLPVDHLVRQKHAGANLNFFKLEQVALPPPDAYDVPAPWQPDVTIATWVLRRFAHAVAWHPGLHGLAAELAGLGVEVPAGPAEPDRGAALADLDAAHAVLLGLDRADLEHVLGTFGALRTREEREHGRFVTAERVLAAYDRLA
jgi:hypothetical protein